MSITRQLYYNLVKNRNSFSALNTNRRQLLKQLNSICVVNMTSFEFSSVDNLRVEHNSNKHEFYVTLGNEKAVLLYSDVSPGVLELYHTEVPEALQGKGIAKKLAQEAFDFVVNKNLKMYVTCTYLQKFLSDNPKPEYLKQVVK